MGHPPPTQGATMMTTESGRSPTGRATHERSRVAPSPPSVSVPNAVEIARTLTEAQLRCLKVLGDEFKAPPRGHAYWAASMSYGHRLTRWRYADTRLGNKRLYALTQIGQAVKRAASAIEAPSGVETVEQGSTEGESAVGEAETPDLQDQPSEHERRGS